MGIDPGSTLLRIGEHRPGRVHAPAGEEDVGNGARGGFGNSRGRHGAGNLRDAFQLMPGGNFQIRNPGIRTFITGQARSIAQNNQTSWYLRTFSIIDATTQLGVQRSELNSDKFNMSAADDALAIRKP